MKFTIDAVILWPRSPSFEPRVISFTGGKINIIYGVSGTGKSSIVHIIDYVLGSTKCQIPIGVIRDTVDWFGLKISLLDAQYIVARRSPRGSQGSNDFYMQIADGAIPESVARTHSQSQYKAAFDGMTRVSDIPHSDEEDPSNFDRRSSYRDMAAFNFLPQHIVANPNTLFFKTDSFVHREKLIRAMPYALGMVDAAYIMNERRRDEAMREQDKLRKQMALHEDAKATHYADVNQIYDRCIELGLIPRQALMSVLDRIDKLRLVLAASNEGRLEESLLEPNRLHISEKLKEVIASVGQQQRTLDELDAQIDGFESLAQNSKRFIAAIETERGHVIGLDWLKSNVSSDGNCVACGSFTNALPQVIENLEAKVNKVTRITDALQDNPVLDKQVAALKRKRSGEERTLSALRREQNRLIQEDDRTRRVLGEIYFVAGEISRLLKQLDGSTGSQEISVRMAELETIIRGHNMAMSRVDRGEQERKVDRQLSPMIEEYADKFALNGRPDALILLDRKELTLRFEVDGQKDYLWEIGSGENWMGYHIAAFLGIHEYLSQECNHQLPPFSFIVIDQPSQVYFPSSSGGNNALDDDFAAVTRARPADIVATRRIFEVLSEGLKRAGHFFQIIVLEHAGPDIWGRVPHTVEVAAWERKGDGLIPEAWIRAS